MVKIHASMKQLFLVSVFLFCCGTHGVVVVHGAASIQRIVTCLPAASDICIGELSMTSPSPMIACSGDDPTFDNCTTTYRGGYSWDYKFVEGLQEGEDDLDLITNSFNGMEVSIRVTDDLTCEITINGTEKCEQCFLDGCYDKDDDDSITEIYYDCTNIQNGKKAPPRCDSLEPFLYPFVLNNTTGVAVDMDLDKEANEIDVEEADVFVDKSSAKDMAVAARGIFLLAVPIVGTLLV